MQGAVYTRPSRGQLLDTLDEEYIRAARAKGLSGRRVVADIIVDLVYALLDPRVGIA